MSNDTIPVRKGEELDIERLKTFLQTQGIEKKDISLKIEQFGEGFSNLTYLLKLGNREVVLRRPPKGPVAPKAHDMHREYIFLKHLSKIYDVAPKPLFYSNDKSIVGTPFFIMERKKGIVLNTKFPDDIPYSPELGRKVSDLMVDKLVELHELNDDIQALVEITKPEGFMKRQVLGWIKRYKRVKTEEIESLDKLFDYLMNNIPERMDTAIIHYDYKLNNIMFSEDFSKMNGLFDWEMSTIGDPLADLAVAMSYWIEQNDNDLLKYGLGKPPVTIMKGFYTRQQFIEKYAKKSGRDVSNIPFYMTFAYLKLAVIGQQIYYRYKKGQTEDPRFAKMNELVKNMMRHGISNAGI